MTEDIEPLAAELWFRQFEKLANGEFACIERALRHTSHLLQLTPAPFRHVLRLAIEEDRLEALLEAEEFDTAARHLIAQPTAFAYEVEQKEDSIRATVSCPILGRAVHGTGSTVASAILAVLTTGLLSLRDEFGENLLSGPRQLEHRYPIGQDRRSF